jgi:FlaA1/EpsC-like NDP-sugar epimerase
MGLKIGEDIDIVYSGLRPGEKIHEELVTDEEEVEPTGNEKIMMVKSPPFDWIILKKKIEELVKNLNHYNPEEVKEILISMVIENQRSFTQNHR